MRVILPFMSLRSTYRPALSTSGDIFPGQSYTSGPGLYKNTGPHGSPVYLHYLLTTPRLSAFYHCLCTIADWDFLMLGTRPPYTIFPEPWVCVLRPDLSLLIWISPLTWQLPSTTSKLVPAFLSLRYSYGALANRLYPNTPWLEPPPIAPGPEDATLRSFQTRVAMAPFLASPWTFLPRPALRLWIASHLGLPVFAPEQRCSYIPLTAVQTCKAALGLHSHHAYHCAFGPRMHRHNQLCRPGAPLLWRAGWHLQIEQNIPLLDDNTKRADLAAVSPTRLTTVCDLQVTATSDYTLSAGPTLEAAAQNKARLYHTTLTGNLLGGRRFMPLIHSAGTPWMHDRTLQFLHELCRHTAMSTCPADSPTWGPHFALQRNQAASDIGYCLAFATSQMHAACGTLLA